MIVPAAGRLGLRARLGEIVFQPLDAVLRLGQRRFLHERHLRHPIGCLAIGGELIGDEAIGLRIDGWQGRLGGGRHAAAEPAALLRAAADPGDETADDVAFFRCHGASFLTLLL